MEMIKGKSIEELIVTSREVVTILGISQARLSQLVKTNKLVPIKKNIFLMEDVDKRRLIQEELRSKFYRPKKEKR